MLATVGAIFSCMGGATQANAGLFKNNAAIRKTEASNQWAFYQAKSGKQHLAELAVVLAAMALLTRRNWLQWAMVGVAGLGLALGAAAALHV